MLLQIAKLKLSITTQFFHEPTKIYLYANGQS